MSNVLIVEADAIVRNLMIRVLSRQGFTVYEAATEEEAMILCKSFGDDPLELVIADHQTVQRTLTEHLLAHCQNTKVLHISGWPFEMVEQRQVLMPGSSFLRKPFTAAELVETVQQLLHPRMQ